MCSFLKRVRDPHTLKIVEISRASSPVGNLDAILVESSGRNLTLYVVKAGKPVQGASQVANFVHCLQPEAMTVSWRTDELLAVHGACEEVSAFGLNPVVERDDQTTVFRIVRP